MDRRSELKKWNKPDTEWGMKLIIFIAVALYAIYTLHNIAIDTYTKITTHNLELAKAEVINDEIKSLYHKGQEWDMVLFDRLEEIRLKTIYNEQEEAEQRKLIEKAHKKIAERLVPTGTYIYLQDDFKAVRVNGHIGLECTTYEGVMFLATDNEKYKTLSEREYNALKKNEKD